MEQKTIKTAAVVAVAGLLTLVVIVLCYYLLNAPDEAGSIMLPDYAVIPSDEPQYSEQELLAEVTAENIQQVLDMMTPLDSYHRVLTMEHYWEDGSVTQTGEVWRRGEEYKLVLSDPAGGASKHVLLRGDGTWMWYEGEQPISIAESMMSVEEMLGIPSYAALGDTAAILDAEYATLAGANQTACVYVKWRNTEVYTTACWVAVDTGLVVRAVGEENGVMVYRMQQSSLERVLPGDEAYQTPFLLPDEDSENQEG